MEPDCSCHRASGGVAATHSQGPWLRCHALHTKLQLPEQPATIDIADGWCHCHWH